MTWIDCFFFDTVASTTVGYGHILWPQSFGAKLFCTFYFVISSTIVGNFILVFSELYGRKKRDEVYSAILESTVSSMILTWPTPFAAKKRTKRLIDFLSLCVSLPPRKSQQTWAHKADLHRRGIVYQADYGNNSSS